MTRWLITSLYFEFSEGIYSLFVVPTHSSVLFIECFAEGNLPLPCKLIRPQVSQVWVNLRAIRRRQLEHPGRGCNLCYSLGSSAAPQASEEPARRTLLFRRSLGLSYPSLALDWGWGSFWGWARWAVGDSRWCVCWVRPTVDSLRALP